MNLQVEDATITPVSPNASVHSPMWFPELSDYPVAFKLENGRIVEIYPDVKETEQILNMKRGIISAFQIYVTGQDGTRTVEEVTCSAMILKCVDTKSVFSLCRLTFLGLALRK